jgi:hypothetical protein
MVRKELIIKTIISTVVDVFSLEAFFGVIKGMTFSHILSTETSLELEFKI